MPFMMVPETYFCGVGLEADTLPRSRVFLELNVVALLEAVL